MEDYYMENSTASFTLMELFRMGGFLMWPLLLFSIAAIALVVERIIYLLYHNLKMDDLKQAVEDGIKCGHIEELKEYLQGQTRRRMGPASSLRL